MRRSQPFKYVVYISTWAMLGGSLAGCSDDASPAARPASAVPAKVVTAATPAPKAEKPRKRKDRRKARKVEAPVETLPAGLDPEKVRQAEDRYATSGYLWLEEHPEADIPVFSIAFQGAPMTKEDLYVLIKQGYCVLVPAGTEARRMDLLHPEYTIGLEVTSGEYAGYRGWTPHLGALHTRPPG